ncbi:MAG: branched-chain amino acid ABC transporter permease [Thermodesulfobacteriota bacterium]
MNYPAAETGLSRRQWAGLAGWIGVWFLPLIWIDPTTYAVLSVAGLTMGMLLFLTSAGLTLVFGLMDVLNFAHGAFFAWGAYLGFSVFNVLNARGWVEMGGLGRNVSSLLLALAVAAGIGLILGVLLERVIIRRVYGSHLKQILITLGASLVLAEIIKIVWGPNDEVMLVPGVFQGSIDVADVVISRYRLLALLVGVIVFALIYFFLKRTKLGIIVRGGVENREMVQALGYNIHRIFTGVFASGAALAAMGGVMWAIFKEQIHPGMGEENLIFAFIVVILGGMGSVTGCFLGAVMVGLAYNYMAFLAPKLALGVNILIMAIILLLKPKGLLGTD